MALPQHTCFLFSEDSVRLYEYRREQRALLESDSSLTLGDVTTVNLSMAGGGVQVNVVPDQFTLGVDIRVTPR